MSTLKVNNIAGVSGGTSPPITLSGDTATLGSGATIGHAAKVVSAIDTFYITNTSFSTSVVYLTVTPYSDAFYSPVSGIVTRETTHNSAFSFSRTGVYQVNYALQVQDTDDDNSMRIRVWATTDGTLPTSSNSINSNAPIYEANHGRSDYRQVLQGNFILNINSADIKIRFSNDNSSTTQSTISTTGYLESYIQFIQLGNSI